MKTQDVVTTRSKNAKFLNEAMDDLDSAIEELYD